jgi:uncharacterized protein YgiM (DUF1202 family)
LNNSHLFGYCARLYTTRIRAMSNLARHNQVKTITNHNYRIWICTILFTTALVSGCGNPGYVSDPSPASHPYVNVAMLNMRACPSTTCRIVSVLKRGTSGLILQEKDGWVELDIDESNSTGWVSSRYLSLDPVEQRTGKQEELQPAIPDEEFASPGQASPVPTEELATPEPDLSIKEEFAQ